MGEKIGTKVEKIHNLTSLQEGILFHKILDHTSQSYLLQSTTYIHGNLDRELIQDAISLLPVKYDVLKAVIAYKKVKNPLMVIMKERSIEFNVIDFMDCKEKMNDSDFIEHMKERDLERGFDLEKDSLVRVVLIGISENLHVMIWSFHHILVDGWSIAILMNDFKYNYKELISGTSKTQLMKEIDSFKQSISTYEQYIQWLSRQDMKKGLAYWEALLENFDEVSDIIPDNSKIEQNNLQVAECKVIFDIDCKNRITALAKERKITVNVVLETAVGILLQKYNHSNDVVFGKVISGRNADLPGIGEMVGLFINTIPVRTKSEDNTTVHELMEQMQNQSLNSELYSFCSLAEIQNKSIPNSNLVKILFAFENYYENEQIDNFMKELVFETEDEREQTNYNISITAFFEESLVLNAMFCPETYSEDEMVRLLTKLQTIIMDMVEHTDKRVCDIREISECEERLILHEFNHTTEPFSSERTISERFEELVDLNPDQIALILCDRTLTYRELNKRANQLAWKLREFGIGTEDYVAISAGRSVEMIVGIIGIIKAGAAYVPIDTAYPAERIKYMLEDCQPKLILNGDIKLSSAIEIPMWSLLEEHSYKNNEENPECVTNSNSLAYLLYTSGTTGKPKGVMIEHKGVLALQHYLKTTYEVKKEDIVLQFANSIFDASVWEMTMALLNGAALCIIPEDIIADSSKFSKYLTEKKVSVALLPPQYYLQSDVRGLRILTTGGSAADAQVVKRAIVHGAYVNAYGPTENTVLATGWSYTEEMEIPSQVPIGKPITNTKVYVMNEGNLCGIGIPGELCIAGSGLARGYLNQKELTDQKFIDNPFGEGKLYRSGDLVKWLQNGDLEFMGRMDDQIKIRGFRIELGEIEYALRQQDGIADAVAAVQTDKMGEKYICAYYTSEKSLDIKEIKLGMQEELPKYMIPSHFMQIQSIPINRSGKVDRKKLPGIEITGNETYIAARNRTEEKIANVFKEILGVHQIGIYDDFFDLGGHSLRATRLINAIEGEVGVRLSLKQIFEGRTVEALALLVDGQHEGENEVIPKAKAQEYYPMSSAQKRIFLVNQMAGTELAYNMPFCAALKGTLDMERIRFAFQMLVDRHEILRTGFFMYEGELVQKIVEKVETEVLLLSIEKNDISSLYERFISKFELEHPPLIRMTAIEVGKEDMILFLDMHHIISDGMSLNIIIEEFSKLYNGEELEINRLQYKDYSEWMRIYDFSAHKKYWSGQFDDEIPSLELPLDYKRPQVQSFHGKTVGIHLGEDLNIPLAQLAKRTGTTDYMIFLSAFMMLGSIYSRQQDIIIGSPISGRTHKDVENMLGMFANTLALRGKPEKNKSIIQFLEEIKEICLKAYEYQEYPFEELLEIIHVERDMSRNPVFDVMFVLQNNEDKNFTLNETELREELDQDYTVAKFDLTINAEKIKDETYYFSFEYCTDLFSEETIQRMMKHFIKVISLMVSVPNEKIGLLELLELQEKEQIIQEFNNTSANYPREETVTQLFEHQAKLHPDKTAVVFKDERITYGELNQKANQLARSLKGYGVGNDDIVAIKAEKSLEMMIGILAIIKAGGAYVSLDKSLPEERVRYMIDDCKPKIILTDHPGNMQMNHIPTLSLSNINLLDGEMTNLENSNTAESLIYLIYTSGTTGKPKGTMIRHRSVVRLVKNTNYLTLDQSSVILQSGAISFDASTFEIWGSLLNGGELCFVDNEILTNPKDLKISLQELKINTMWMTSTLFNQMITSDPAIFDSLTYLLIGGEKLSKKHVEMLQCRNQTIRLINGYGPTENTTFTTTYEIPKQFTTIPIGKPIANTQVYVMEEGVLCPIGIPGELCIAGDGLATGYLNQEDLTNNKFINNPFGEGKLYRSGDLVKWLPDGNLEFLGRVDEQVKIRGFRIELGEIETALRCQADIKDAAATVYTNEKGDKSICAYYVAEYKMDSEKIRMLLQKELPEYMVPNYFMQLDHMPVNRNGKIDKNSLPEIEVSHHKEYTPPQNDTEMKLVEAFETVLGLDQIGINDNFFLMGGDSIKAIRIVSKLREYNMDLALKDIINGKVIKVIAKSIKSMEAKEYSQEEFAGEVQMLPIQKAFFEVWNMKNLDYFNQTMIVKTKKFDQVAIKEAVKAIVLHHDMLRSVYRDKKIRILNSTECKFFDYFELDARDLEREELVQFVQNQCMKIQRGMRIEEGPLVKIAFITTNEETHLMLCIHHLVVDGVSWRIILEDLENGYKQYIQTKKIILPKKTASFQDWAKGMQEYAHSDKLIKEHSYWKEMSEEAFALKLESHGTGHSEFSEKAFGIDEKLTESILYNVNEKYNSDMNDILLTALTITLYRCLGKDKIIVNLEGHGREEIHKPINISRTVGWFTVSYPVILQAYKDIEQTIIHTKETLRKIPNKGIGYGILREQISLFEVERLDICFNYFGEMDDHVDGRDGAILMSQLSAGDDWAEENVLPGNFTFTGHIAENKLQFNILYHTELYKEALIDDFCSSYKNVLNELVCFILQDDEQVKTLSDIHAKDVNQEELKNINSIIEGIIF